MDQAPLRPTQYCIPAIVLRAPYAEPGTDGRLCVGPGGLFSKFFRRKNAVQVGTALRARYCSPVLTVSMVLLAGTESTGHVDCERESATVGSGIGPAHLHKRRYHLALFPRGTKAYARRRTRRRPVLMSGVVGARPSATAV